MDSERFMRAFGEINDEYLQNANELYNLWQDSQTGVSVAANYSRKATLKTIIVSVACTAAVMFGLFVLFLNVGKIGIIGNSGNSNNTPGQNGSVYSSVSTESNNGNTSTSDKATPCDHKYYRLEEIEQTDVSYDTHNYTCTVTYYTYRHAKRCTECNEYLGEGPTFLCTEEHTCGNHIKECTGAFLTDDAQ